ncbi:MAG: glycosyltransferase family 4 protein [Cytophagales bacterium]|nr:glycosyltransferase family 4 protein [Cytophagales bacterium]MDW8384164.1 glycosyltransferase family 4 protein [Flammeovirgaceae bacterium]
MKKRKRVLFYYSNNKSSISIETLLEELQKRGYKIYFLSTTKRGTLHDDLEKYDIRCWAHPVEENKLYYIKQILFLVWFCWKHRIEVVYSNLQHANVIACIAQFFFRAKLIVGRHHFDFVKEIDGISYTPPSNEILFDKIINRLAKVITVPSSGVYNGMKNYEKVDIKKVYIVPYIYDFSKYPKPDEKKVAEIRQRYSSKLILLACMRLMKLKRHLLLLEIVKELLEEGYDVQLICLDNGPEKERLELFIKQHQLEEKVHLLGFQTEYIQYMMAADLLLHPSLTEASNSVVKEMGMLAKLVVVCKGVGDFDDYIEHRKNGFLVSREHTHQEMKTIIKEVYQNPIAFQELGIRLRETVYQKFNRSEEVLRLYDKLFQN